MPVLPRAPALAAALALLAGAAGAQPAPSSVHGTVRDAARQPLAGVSVYLSGTTRGTATDAQGRYRIDGVAPGSYRLVGSMVGYETQTVPVLLAAGDGARADLRLAPAVETLAGVRVEAPADRRWQRRLARFQRAILGESANADSARILNPEVLEFSSSWGALQATAAAPLVIENRALGYRLRYDLRSFSVTATEVRYDGDEVFEEIAPASAAEAFRWAAARRRAYRGSMPHLLRSMLAGTAAEEGYTLALAGDDAGGRRTRGDRAAPTTADRLVRVGADGWATLTVRGRLEVVYDGEPEEPAYLRSAWFQGARRRPAPYQRSGLTTSRLNVRLDPQGTPLDPFAVSTTGHMGFERLADRVPRDYGQPPAPADDGP